MTHDAIAIWNGSNLAELLTVESLGGDRFRMPCNERNAGGEIFGGQYLGQALAAALATGAGRAPHAMHGFFLSAARADLPLEATVSRVREGRSFTHRHVELLQGGRVVFRADVSLHDPEPGQPGHQLPPPDVTPPEQLRDMNTLLEHYGDEVMGALARTRLAGKPGVEIRPVDALAGLVEAAQQPVSHAWLRARGFVTDDPLMGYAALAYLSDYWTNSPSRIVHSRSLFDGRLTSVSLNQTLWFQRQPKIDDWLLFALDGPSTFGGCGLNRGLMYDREGHLLMMAAQEALVRAVRSESA